MRLVGNNAWYLYGRPGTDIKNIALARLFKQEGDWCVKHFTEHDGPGYYDCPLSLIKKTTPVTPGSIAAAWREKVALHHLNRKNQTKENP